MSRQLTRTQAAVVGGVATVVVIGASAINGSLLPEGDTLQIIHGMVGAAGWHNARPKVVQETDGTLLTDPLPVAGGCGVRLAFNQHSLKFKVAYYTTADPSEYIVSVMVRDKEYPNVLQQWQSPSKKQIDDELNKAGLGTEQWCNPIAGA